MIKTSLNLKHFIQAKRVGAGAPWPLCMTCGRPVDSEELVEGSPGQSETAKVLVRHHGAEEVRTFDFGTRYWNSDQLARYMHAAHWFDPHNIGGAVTIARRTKADD